MSVLLPNTTATVRRRVEGDENAYGERVAAGFDAGGAMLDARVRQRSDGGWALGVDDSLWPVRVGDLIVDAKGRTFVVQTADLLVNNYDDTVNWVRVEGLRRDVAGTEPADPWFVARFVPTGSQPPVTGSANLLTGHGPPPDGLTADVGDEYIDLDTGIIYEFREA